MFGYACLVCVHLWYIHFAIYVIIQLKSFLKNPLTFWGWEWDYQVRKHKMVFISFCKCTNQNILSTQSVPRKKVSYPWVTDNKHCSKFLCRGSNRPVRQEEYWMRENYPFLFWTNTSWEHSSEQGRPGPCTLQLYGLAVDCPLLSTCCHVLLWEATTNLLRAGDMSFHISGTPLMWNTQNRILQTQQACNECFLITGLDK